MLRNTGSCYGFRLDLPSARLPGETQSLPALLYIRTHHVCLEQFLTKLFYALLFFLLLSPGSTQAQVVTPPAQSDLPAKDEILTGGVLEDSNAEWRHLRGSARVQTTEMSITADQIDYNSDTHWAYARGHVRLEHYRTGDIINAEKGEFNLETDEGKFFGVDGTAPAKLMTNPAALTTTNPFYFQARWVDRIKNRYILHHGFITDCKLPKPWWIFQAPSFDIIPGDRAIARSALFRVKRIPVLYLPYFRRPLGRNPRQSGFLTPNFGHTTLFGYVYGLGYYWAINRSYDMTGVVQYFTQRGPAFSYNFRGKPNDVSDINFALYSVDDMQGVQNHSAGCQSHPTPGCDPKQGGTQFQVSGHTTILGFNGRLEYNYLSSFLFRQAFSYSFASAIQSEVYSLGYLQRHFQDDRYTFNIVAERDQLFEAVTPVNATPNQVVVQKLPSLEFLGRDQQLVGGPVPVWFSFDTSGSLLTRSEPLTYNGAVPMQILHSGATSRINVEPHISTAFSFDHFSLVPGISFGATDYSKSYAANTSVYQLENLSNPTKNVQLASDNLFRKYADFTLGLQLPTLEKIFTPPAWLHLGPKLKHVIEADAAYEYVTGVNNFQRTVHFDETDIVSNTNQLTVSLTNRLYRKDKNGNVNEIFTWKLSQARYFDPTFGGAVLPNVRNVVLATEELTPFTFLDGPRSYSPIVSSLTVSPYPFISFNWRADYDPLPSRSQVIVNQTYGVTVRHSKYFASVSDNAINTNRLLLPPANQIIFGGGYGNTNRRGWNVAGLVDYDLQKSGSTSTGSKRLYDFIQTSYNTNCCGFSFEIRQYNLGIRNENQYLFSFSVANIGTVGSLPRQGRIF